MGINEIIEKAETAKASFYQHFRSKETLCCEWLAETHGRSEEFHRCILECETPAREKVLQYFRALGPWLESRDFRGCPFSNTAADGESQSEEVRREVERHKLFLRDFLVELAGGITDDEDEQTRLGNTLFLLYSGATAEAQNVRSLWPVEQAIAAVEGLLPEQCC